MASDTVDALTAFTWERQPTAARLIAQLLDKFVAANEEIARLSDRLRDETGNRLADWVDSLIAPADWSGELAKCLAETGFVDSGQNLWRHPEGIFPVVQLAPLGPAGLCIKVESVEDFASRYPVPNAKPQGKPRSAYRTLEVSKENDTLLVATERHGWSGFELSAESDAELSAAKKHLEEFCKRKRDFADAAVGYTYTKKMIKSAVTEIGVDHACDLFFAAERKYWQSRNHAARVQYERQQKLGLGWANHDHHTYRSSRSCFHLLVEMLELLGFHCRERFYAGIEAGWGAQVLEQSGAGFVVFADVDMSPEEVAGDFAHLGLPPRAELGTVGLWCQLHGEAFLSAGMHHLECQFDFDRARTQLAEAGVETMAPFTDFPHLRQAFTTGEIWQVDPKRIDAALSAGQITAKDAEQFRREGAIGSHLEILERNEGYKGFNQTGVSDIIARTDPRKWRG